jgi:hypothetical protein
LDIRGYVLSAIGTVSAGQSAQGLWEVLRHIDYYQRIVPTHEELLSAIAGSIRDGRLIEIAHLQYSEPSPGWSAVNFSGLSEAEYDLALSEYREWFAAERSRIESRGGV